MSFPSFSPKDSTHSGMRLRNKYIPSPELPLTNADEDVEETSQPVEEPLAEQTATPRDMANASGMDMQADPAVADRSSEMTITAIPQKSFPAPDRYDDPYWFHDSDLLSRAPWYDRAALEHPEAIAEYATDGMLPGDRKVSCYG